MLPGILISSLIITLIIKINAFVSYSENSENILPKPKKLNWDSKIKDKYQNLIKSAECQSILKSFMEIGVKAEPHIIDASVKLLSDIMVETAERADHSIQFVRNLGPAPPRVGGCRRSVRPHIKRPIWHEKSCNQAYSDIQKTAALLRKDPNNAWLRGKLNKENKFYKKLQKQQQGQFIDKLFGQLDQCQNNDPKKYMELVKKIRDGTFDKKFSSDSDSVSPDDWKIHFENLLGPKTQKCVTHENFENYIKNNVDTCEDIFEHPLTKDEVLAAIKSLKNHKSTSFDMISNEMLKASMPTLLNPIVLLFQTMIDNSIYSKYWKLDILSPIHKKGMKDDPNNFRGIAVASCFGKLFNTILKNRLQSFCDENDLINPAQISGKKGARTADHLTVIRFLIEKYTKEGKKLFVCFFDLKKAFDSVNRLTLFYKLLQKYKIGGRFLKMLQDIYDNNQMFIKVKSGLTQPFLTTVGVKQGCVLSPLIFNLFINDLPDQFDDQCDPVHLGGQAVHALMFADDVVILSQSADGLRRSIDITVNYFNSIYLDVNFDKSQIMIFNSRGLLLNNHSDHVFQANGHTLKVVKEYTYLGFKFTPSGCASHGAEELFNKSRRSWFSISNMIYKYKRLKTDKAFQIFDQFDLNCLINGYFKMDGLSRKA